MWVLDPAHVPADRTHTWQVTCQLPLGRWRYECRSCGDEVEMGGASERACPRAQVDVSADLERAAAEGRRAWA